MAFQPGSSATVNLSGAGSQWSNSGTLFVGYSDQANLSINSGGSVTSNGAVIGYQNGSFGNATVTGVGSQWNLGPSGLVVGLDGSATLTISNGALLTGPGGVLGYDQFGVGNVTVTGPGSEWLGTSELAVGWAGHGNLLIDNGGLVTSAGGSQIAAQSGGTGTVTVSGAAPCGLT